MASLQVSPGRDGKAPDGTVRRAEQAGTALAKERRELKQQEMNEEADKKARDMSRGALAGV